MEPPIAIQIWIPPSLMVFTLHRFLVGALRLETANPSNGGTVLALPSTVVPAERGVNATPR